MEDKKREENGRPYISTHELNKQAAKQQVKKEVEPIVKELRGAVDALHVMIPQFQKVDDRSYWNRVGLIILALATFVTIIVICV